jgi:hypothetical protein
VPLILFSLVTVAFAPSGEAGSGPVRLPSALSFGEELAVGDRLAYR